MNEAEHEAELKIATRRYIDADDIAMNARETVVACVLNALRDGLPPTTVAELSPFTATYVRQLARSAGIPPTTSKRRPKRRTVE